MFGIGMGEFILILIAAFVLVGPGDLPKVARWIAKALKYIRVSIKEFMDTMNMDDDIREVKETGKLLRETVHDINPIAEITDEIAGVKRETKDAFSVLGDLNKNILDDADVKKNT